MNKVDAAKKKKHIFKARIVGVLLILFFVCTYFIDKDIWISDGYNIGMKMSQQGLIYLSPFLSSPLGNLIMTILPLAFLTIFLEAITDYFAKISK